MTTHNLQTGDHITITRSAASPTSPAPWTITGTLAALWDAGHGLGGTVQTPAGPVTLDMDCERMLRLYGVVQTITRHVA
jgi:hypothetical protein